LIYIRNQFEIQKLHIMQEIECKKLIIESVKTDCLLHDILRPEAIELAIVSPQAFGQGIVSPRSCRGILSPQAFGQGITKRKIESSFSSSVESSPFPTKHRKIDSNISEDEKQISVDYANRYLTTKVALVHKPMSKFKEAFMTVRQYCTNKNLPVDRKYIMIAYFEEFRVKPSTNMQHVNIYPLSMLNSVMRNIE